MKRLGEIRSNQENNTTWREKIVDKKMFKEQRYNNIPSVRVQGVPNQFSVRLRPHTPPPLTHI